VIPLRLKLFVFLAKVSIMIEENKDNFLKYKKPYIARDRLIEKVNPFIDKDIIKIFTGQRRVGKSYLLFQIGDWILQENSNANIIYINKELVDFDFIQNYQDLTAYVEAKSAANYNYLFIDEVQDILRFELALRSLLAGGKTDIFCTGSNSQLLSGDISGYLSGRSIEINVYSLSYNEFIIFHKIEESSQTFLKYLRYGGLPYLIHLKLEDHIIFDYLRNIYSTILYKDVVNRFNVRNTYFLEQLIKFLADNTGQLFSAKRISDFLKSQKVSVSVQAILNYIDHLRQSFMIFQVSRKDIAGRKIFETGHKYYFEDLGLRNSIIGFRQADIAKILENIVFVHLLIHGYQVTIGNLGNLEIDFVAERFDEKIYIQVTYFTATQETYNREAGNLLKINDNYPKYIVSMDELPASNANGIIHMNIREFLTSFR